MIFLINTLGLWLLLTAAFAALAGWAWAAERGAPADAAIRRERDRLVRDLALLARGEGEAQPLVATDADAMRSLHAIRESRIAELEGALAQHRGRADEAAARAAELERRLEQHQDQSAEITRLTALVEAQPAEQAHPPEDEEKTLQGWRLRYFERRVQFLENEAAPSVPLLPAPTPAEPAPAPPVMEWRAREAEARASYLAQALREREAAPSEPEAAPDSPFAANVDVDMLLRWRMLYLERRTAHLQNLLGAQAAEPAPAVDAEAERHALDQDRWKWRARYLESRVRHLEQRVSPPVALVAAPQAPEAVAPAPEAAPQVASERPSSLPAATNGAPDDLTLIEGVSGLQQSALYSLGVFHFEQIAAWTPANVAWVDRYLRLRGRIDAEEWLQQAADLAREGPEVSRLFAQEMA